MGTDIHTRTRHFHKQGLPIGQDITSDCLSCCLRIWLEYLVYILPRCSNKIALELSQLPPLTGSWMFQKGKFSSGRSIKCAVGTSCKVKIHEHTIGICVFSCEHLPGATSSRHMTRTSREPVGLRHSKRVVAMFYSQLFTMTHRCAGILGTTLGTLHRDIIPQLCLRSDPKGLR